MARNPYAYQADGFAEGFQSGFGLMSDHYERQDRKDIAREELRANAQYRADELGLKRDELRGMEKHRGEEAKYRADEAKYRADEAALTAEHRIKQLENEATSLETAEAQRKDQAEINRIRAETEGKRQDGLDAIADERRKTQERQRINSESFAAADQFIKYWNRVQQGEETWDVSKAQVYLDAAEKGMGSIFRNTGPLAAAAAEDFRRSMIAVSRGEMPDKAALLNIANHVLNQSNKSGTGETVTAETHPNAPESAHGMIVKQKTISDVKYRDGKFTFQTDVVVEDSQGKEYIYQAGVTQNRASGAPSQVVELTFDEIFKAGAGIFQYQNYLAPAREAAMRTRAHGQFREKYSDGTYGKYDQTKHIEAIDRQTEVTRAQWLAKGDAPSPFPGKTYEEAVLDPRFNAYVEAEVLKLNYSNEYQPSEGDALAADVRETRQAKDLNKLLSQKDDTPPLSRSQLLQMSYFFDETTDRAGNTTIELTNEKGYTNFKNKVLGRPKGYKGQFHNRGVYANPLGGQPD